MHRIAGRDPAQSRDDHEDRSNSRERELEPGFEQRGGGPDEEDERSQSEEVPAVARPGGEPGERCERSRDPGADDRRLPTDRKNVRADGAECRSLADEAMSKERSHPSEASQSAPWPLDAWPGVPTKFVLCTEDRFFPPDFLRRLVAERLHITPDEILAGHCVALSRPKELAQLLIGYAHASRTNTSA